MCGNWINPKNRHFLGGPVGQIALPLALSALGPLALGGAGLFTGAEGAAGALGTGLSGAASSGIGGALGGAIAGMGGGLQGALTGGALGGAGGYLSSPGALSSLGMGGTPTAVGQAMDVPDVLQSGFGSSGESLQSGFGGIPGATNASSVINSGGKSIVDGVLGGIQKDPIGALGKLATIYGASTGQMDKNLNANSQQDIIASMKAQNDQQAAYAKTLMGDMNGASLNRTQTPLSSPAAYYHYGENGGQNQFSNPNPPMKFARGGSVGMPMPGGGMPAMPAGVPSAMPPAGLHLSGSAGGQADTVPAKLSDGEFVMPSDVVAHLGDGNNKAGAGKLGALIHHIRAHKASAGAGMPPPAAPLTAYMQGGA